MGCTQSINEPIAEPSKTPLAGNDWWDFEVQGRHILGSKPDTLLTGGKHFRVTLSSARPTGWNLSVTGAGPDGKSPSHLVATHAVFGTVHQADDAWFTDPFGNGSGGFEMNGPNGYKLRIRDVVLETAGTNYFLDIYDPNTGEWTDYCDGHGGAYAVTGSFNGRRIHNTGAAISFACDDGVEKKCMKWGYLPGTGGSPDPFWDLNQTCIQMANAAYCGGALSGLPFTREETPIVIRDYRKDYAMPEPWAAPALTHPNPFPGDPDTFYIEAAWRPDGLAPLCVSKLRWKSLPPNPCPLDLPDPRWNPPTGEEERPGKFCEDYTFTDLFNKGALIINGSMLMDAPTDKWKDPATQDVVTTMRGFYSNVNGDKSASIAPFPTYTQYVGPDGMILRNLTGTLDEATMIPLFTQRETTATTTTGTPRLVLSDDVNLPGYTHVPIKDDLRGPDFEGYAFPPSSTVNGLKLLKVCAQGGDYNTTIAPAACPGGSLAQQMYALPYP
jgi:hypothetical protein